MNTIEKLQKNVLFFFLSLIVIGCASSTHKENTATPEVSKEGQWECKAQLKNLVNNESHIVSLNVFAIKPNNLRLEASGPLGIRLASVLLNEQQFTAIEYSKQKVYIGSAKSKLFASVLKIPIEPKWFYNIFFDEPFTTPGWQCSFDNNKQVKECTNAQNQFKIEWLDRIDDNKRIVISNPQYQLNILTKEHQPKVERPDKVFQIKIPENYKKIQI